MIIIVMGVSGSGKSTVGSLLAERLGWPFYDGDDFHPAANVAKMSAGLPLTDADRAGWLAALADLLQSRIAEGSSAVLACSALKQSYRRQLNVDSNQIRLVYLKGDYDLIWGRMKERAGHYMKPDMLASQFAALEEPGDEAATISIASSPAEIVEQIVNALNAIRDTPLSSTWPAI